MKIKEATERYLNQNLGLNILLSPFPFTSLSIPIFLDNMYLFYEATILKIPCIFMISKSPGDLFPAIIKKHTEILNSQFGCCIYVQENISSFHRIRLIQHGVPFIVPGKQMYLPFLGIHLTEHFLSSATKKNQVLSTATQVAVLRVLLDKPKAIYTPKMLAEQTDYSLMTMLRTFNELKMADIEGLYQKGREHFWNVNDRKTLWEQTKMLLKSPIQQTVWAPIIPDFIEKGIQAGLSALSNDTLLAPPETSTYAISNAEWKKMNVEHHKYPITESGFIELQIWRYEPKFKDATRHIADPFSLYLSLRDSPDERVHQALEERMEKIEW